MNNSQKFLVHGLARKDKVVKKGREKLTGVIVALDFEALHQRVCQGSESPESEFSDYELWSPSGANQPSCLMGHKVTHYSSSLI